jgi:hypothetical protein
MKGINAEFIAYEPKKKNRFMVKFPDQLPIKEWVLPRISPLVYDGESNEWEDVKIEAYDPIATSTSEVLLKYIHGKKHQPTIKVKVITLDPVGTEVETKVLTCKIKKVTFSEYDWEKDDLSNVEIILKVFSIITEENDN